MQLAANITVGWADLPKSQFCAQALHSRAIAAPHYERSLFHQLQLAKADTRILGLDQLFRRACGSYQPLLQLARSLNDLPNIPNLPAPLLCDIDLFAYAFLAGVQNFDLLLPLVHHNSVALAQILSDCQEAVRSLEDFERTGALPSQMSELDAQQYLALRRAVARPSAQLELQTLAVLLVSGPSAVIHLTQELTTEPGAARRILNLFESIEIVTRWGEEPGSSSTDPLFVIDKVAVPLVIFCLKEILGLDLMGNLSALLDANYG